MAIPQDVKERIISLYNTDISIKSISTIVGVSEITITKIIKNAGITIRRKNYQKLTIDKIVVNNMYNNGQSTYQIAKHFKCSDETIRKMIDNMRDQRIRNKLSQESLQKISEASTANWRDQDYIDKVKDATSTIEYKQKLINAGKANYDASLGGWIKNAESKLIISAKIKELWNDPEFRLKQEVWFAQRGEILTAASKKSLSDPLKRQAWINKLRTVNANKQQSGGWISSAQKQLYYILSSSGISFYEEGPETRVGPFYVVDCVIPTQQSMVRPLIIEVQGEYWHSLPHVMIKDKQKATYIRKHTDFDLLTIDELQLASFTEVESQLLKYGLRLNSDICKPRDLDIRKISEVEASVFYSIFHYSGTIRKGAIVFGAYFNDKLVAAISYCHALRNETAIHLKCERRNVMEISRLARCTNLKCKNLMSYLISKTKKLLPDYVQWLVTFSDATYGHTGGVYKASGFTADGVIPPDYHYISINGKYHKKTIWDRAKRMRMTESEYAIKHNLIAVKHSEKTRWVCKLR